jgi:hypothetical protein
MPRKTTTATLNRLYSVLSRTPPNVASLKYDPVTGAFEATFREAQVSGTTEEYQDDTRDMRYLLEEIAEVNFPKQSKPAGQ